MTADFAKENIDLEIILPPGTKVLVSVGDKVESGQVVAHLAGKSQEFDLAKLLGVPGKKVGKLLAVSLGSKVKKGQRVAEKKALFKKTFFESPLDGLLEALSEKGILKIKEEKEGKEMVTPVPGKVKKIEGEKIFIEVPATTFVGDWTVGSSGWGVIKLACAKEKSGLKDLSGEVGEEILLFKGEVPSALVYKAEALGVVGLVVGAADRQAKCDDLAMISLGGKEGKIPDSLWKNLAKFEGQKARILGGKNLLIIC